MTSKYRTRAKLVSSGTVSGEVVTEKFPWYEEFPSSRTEINEGAELELEMELETSKLEVSNSISNSNSAF